MQPMQYVYPATLRRDRAGRYVVRFPDLPEALTDGATRDEALAEASDCLSEALMGRIADGEPIPRPSPLSRGRHAIAPDAAVALKVALHQIAAEERLGPSALARRLRVDNKEARRLLDPRHPTKLPRLAAALDALGHRVLVTVTKAA